MIDINPAIEWRGLLLDGIGDSHTVMLTRQTNGIVTSWSDRTHSTECKEICDLLLLHLQRQYQNGTIGTGSDSLDGPVV